MLPLGVLNDPIKPKPAARDATKVRVPGPNPKADSLEAVVARHPAFRGAEGNVYDMYADEARQAAELRKGDSPVDEFALRFGGDRAQIPARGVAEAEEAMNDQASEIARGKQFHDDYDPKTRRVKGVDQPDPKSQGMAILAKLLLSK